MQELVDEMMVEAKAMVKALVEQAGQVRDGRGAEALERSVRQKGQQFLRVLLERLLQSVLGREGEARRCPRCGDRRRHKGRRWRGVVSSVGALRLEGPYAYQHVHEAARKIHGEGTSKAAGWADQWCRHLREHGGRVTWWSLRRVRYKDPERQEALEALLGYLDRQADRLDYPRYERAGWPISSGAMESYCKQLGGRLKGPGMRWSQENVNPMAALVTLWSQDRWDEYWSQAG